MNDHEFSLTQLLRHRQSSREVDQIGQVTLVLVTSNFRNSACGVNERLDVGLSFPRYKRLVGPGEYVIFTSLSSPGSYVYYTTRTVLIWRLLLNHCC